MKIILKYKQFFLHLVVCGALAFFGHVFSALAILSIIVLQFFYFLFYTQRPVMFWFFCTMGYGVALYNYVLEFPLLVNIYAGLCLLECIRIILFAVLKYPATIRDYQTLVDELEQRVNERTAELREANHKMSLANEKLRELDKMKTAFVSQASHDLRTPLAAIKGSLDNLSLGVAGELTEKQKRILTRATKSVDRLTALINDILDLSRIESGRTSLERSTLSVRNMVLNAIQENKPAADVKEIQIDSQITEDPCLASIDPAKIERAMNELINNAIKYTPKQGTVEVQLNKNQSNLQFSVKDNGIGIPKDECEKIFERFYRTRSSKEFAKGSGLGLSIVKELVEMHGGSVTVQSEEGHGTTFQVLLPLG